MDGTVPQRQLARELKRLRERAGIRLQDAAQELGCSPARLSRIERLNQKVDLQWVKGMLDLYGADDEWTDMVALAKLARQRGWWRAYGLTDRGYVPLEASASLVREFNITSIPGLLQTEDYTRALFDSALIPVSDERREQGVRVRQIRQRRLFAEEDPLRLIAVVDESVLKRPVGGHAVLRNQLDHLLLMADLESVTLLVLPTDTGAHPGLDGGYTLLSFDGFQEPDLAYVEHVAGAVHLEKEEQVSRCSLAFDRLRSAALGPADTADLLERMVARA